MFIDLFAGCGGLSLGLMEAGWRGLFAVEKSPRAFQTLKANLIDERYGVRFEWPDWLPEEAIDISEFNQKYWRRLRDLRGSVDLVAGGPPCQGFSFAGTRRKEDPRNRLFLRFLKVVELVRPRMILIENVQGIAIEHGRKERRNNPGSGRRRKAFSRRIRDQLINDQYGYATWADEVKAGDCGVAQWRPRVFIVGVRRDLLASVDEDEFDPFEVLRGLRSGFLEDKGIDPQRPVTVEEAISDLRTEGKEKEDYPGWPGFQRIRYSGPETAYQELLRRGLNGETPNSLRLPNHRKPTVKRFQRIMDECRAGVALSPEEKERLGIRKHTLVRLAADAPSHTLTTLPDDYVHYSEPRVLTVREMARLQSFPDWFVFKGKYTTGGPVRTQEVPRYSQVGNAVAPFVAELFGRTLDEIDRQLPADP